MKLPLIPVPWVAAARAVPSWVYIGGAISAATLIALGVASQHGAEKQATADAPLVGRAVVADGEATLSWNATEDASARHEEENSTSARGDVHEAAVRGAPDGGHGALIEWLCDTPGVQPGCPPKGG